LADPIYEAFYGLSDQPFAITTDPKFFYLSGAHQQAFGELLNGLRRREGILLLTGETGTGKTTLSRAVLETLGPRTFSSMILNPYMTGAEVFRVVLRDFGLVSREDIRRGALAAADVPQLIDTLEGFLRSLASLDSHAVIVLDEAQSLSAEVLDQVRLLTAFEKDNRSLVQVVLSGQPALLDTLKSGALTALRERITRRVAISPLATSDVDAYIQHRLAVAGGAKAVSFSADASKIVADVAHGLPRRINVLCDRAMHEGRVAGVTIITSDIVKRAARSLTGLEDRAPATEVAHAGARAIETVPAIDFATAVAPKRRVPIAAMAAAGLLLCAVLAGYGYYAASTIAATVVPAPPAAPRRDLPALAEPLPVPPNPDQEFRRLLVPRAPRDPLQELLDQLPDNPNQLN
jgi:general secretion pathway protein A